MKKLLFVLTVWFSALISICYANEKPVVLIIGTRPEAIKMLPVYKALKQAQISTLICSTGQHAELLDSVFTLFDVKPDFDLKIMKPGQDLFYITETVLAKTKELFLKLNPALVIVQGDTTSAMAAAMSAFYLKIPLAHVEAGLRTGNMLAPFPEEMNRRVISLLASYHFAHTKMAASQLISENIAADRIFCTGNTVVDALYSIRDKIQNGEIDPSPLLKSTVTIQKNQGHRILLLTTHRRESFDGGILQILSAVKEALIRHPELYVIYPWHPNPAIQSIIKEIELEKIPNLFMVPPVSYQDMVYLISSVDGVLTDSGGIQEEGVSLNKPVLILRNETDRPEGLSSTAVLVGTNKARILQEIELLIQKNFMSSGDASVYGDGHASEYIAEIIKSHVYSDTLP